MTKEQKATIIQELSEKLASTPFFYIASAEGMSVAETNAFRRKCFKEGVEYKVFKNTLIRKALETLPTDYTPFVEGKVLKGTSGVLFHNESGKVPAKLIKDFIKETKTKKLTLKGASIDSSLFIGHNQLDILVALKSKQELVGEVIGLLQSPAKNVISALQSGGQKIAGIVKTLAERQ